MELDLLIDRILIVNEDELVDYLSLNQKFALFLTMDDEDNDFILSLKE